MSGSDRLQRLLDEDPNAIAYVGVRIPDETLRPRFTVIGDTVHLRYLTANGEQRSSTSRIPRAELIRYLEHYESYCDADSGATRQQREVPHTVDVFSPQISVQKAQRIRIQTTSAHTFEGQLVSFSQDHVSICDSSFDVLHPEVQALRVFQVADVASISDGSSNVTDLIIGGSGATLANAICCVMEAHPLYERAYLPESSGRDRSLSGVVNCDSISIDEKQTPLRMGPALSVVAALGYASSTWYQPLAFYDGTGSPVVDVNAAPYRASPLVFEIAGLVRMPIRSAWDITTGLRFATVSASSQDPSSEQQVYHNSFLDVRGGVAYVIHRRDVSGYRVSELRLGATVGLQMYSVQYSIDGNPSAFGLDESDVIHAEVTARGLQPTASANVQGAFTIVNNLSLILSADVTYTATSMRRFVVDYQSSSGKRSVVAEYSTGAPVLLALGIGVEYAL